MLLGKGHESTLVAANNYADSLNDLGRFKEAKSLLRKTIPVARRALGETDVVTLNLRKFYAMALFVDAGATLDDLREAVETLEDVERIARRGMGDAHPFTEHIKGMLRPVRRAVETIRT